MRRHVRLSFHLVGIGHTEADDAARFAGFHAWGDRLCQVKNGMEIAIEHLIPALDRFVEHIDAMVGTGSVDEDIDAPPFFLNLCHKRLRGNRIRDVTLERKCVPAAFGNGLGRLLGLGAARPITEGNFPMASGEVEGDASADALGSSRNQCDLFSHVEFRS